MTKLILLIGLPGSGKSTLAASLQRSDPLLMLVSTDAIRAQLFGDAAIQGDWLLIRNELQRQFQIAFWQTQEGKTSAAIYDATNARRRNRRQAITLCRSVGFTQVIALWLNTPLKLCLQRNRQRDRQVPDEAIYRMDRQLSGAPPSLEEGLDCLIRYEVS